MHRSILAAIAALGLALVLASCAAEQSSTAPAAEPEGFVNAAPAGTPMSKIKAGMTAQEVVTILGSPQAQGVYTTGKAFIPFYYGSDARRNALYYKGQGRVIIDAGNVFGGGGGNVIAVEYDPSEPGIAR